MTKREAAERKAAWSLALKEGRVVRFPEMDRLTSYPTNERAARAVIEARAAGITATIVEMKEGKVMNSDEKILLLTVARVLRALMRDTFSTNDQLEDLHELNAALAPFDPTLGEVINQDRA